MLQRLVLGTSLTLVLLVGIPALGSGSYTARPPQPPAKAKGKVVDRDKYALGQRLFLGRLKPDAAVDPAPQRERLEKLESLLSERVARKRKLPELAGKLTPEQLEALEYYVMERYGH